MFLERTSRHATGRFHGRTPVCYVATCVRTSVPSTASMESDKEQSFETDRGFVRTYGEEFKMRLHHATGRYK